MPSNDIKDRRNNLKKVREWNPEGLQLFSVRNLGVVTPESFKKRITVAAVKKDYSDTLLTQRRGKRGCIQ